MHKRVVCSLAAWESKEVQHKTGSSFTNAVQLLSTASYTTHLSPVLVISITKTRGTSSYRFYTTSKFKRNILKTVYMQCCLKTQILSSNLGGKNNAVYEILVQFCNIHIHKNLLPMQASDKARGIFTHSMLASKLKCLMRL
jgi:hypothetical protein